MRKTSGSVYKRIVRLLGSVEDATRAEIAQRLGISTVSVGKAIDKLRAMKLVRVSGKRISDMDRTVDCFGLDGAHVIAWVRPERKGFLLALAQIDGSNLKKKHFAYLESMSPEDNIEAGISRISMSIRFMRSQGTNVTVGVLAPDSQKRKWISAGADMVCSDKELYLMANLLHGGVDLHVKLEESGKAESLLMYGGEVIGNPSGRLSECVGEIDEYAKTLAQFVEILCPSAVVVFGSDASGKKLLAEKIACNLASLDASFWVFADDADMRDKLLFELTRDRLIEKVIK